MCVVNSPVDQCVTNFPLFIVTTQTGIPLEVDGLLGLSTNGAGKPENLFIEQLKALNLIASKVFAIGFNSNQTNALTTTADFMDVGRYDPSRMRSN